MFLPVPEILRAVPDDVLARWQDMVNIMAQIIRVPTAIIARIDEPDYEIYRVNSPNPHGLEAGRQFPLTDVYCETVYKTRLPLQISNALQDERWKNHPEVRIGYISYLGYPIFLPTGEVFGTICVFDVKENGFSDDFHKMIFLFKDQIESHIHLLCRKLTLEDLVNQRTRLLTKTNAKLLEEMAERRRAHEAVKQGEARLRNVLENSLVGISISRDGKPIYQNPEHERTIGPVPDGATFPYLENIHPEDRERIEALYLSFSAGETATCETEFRFYPFGSARRTQDLKWIHCRAIQIRDHNSPAILESVVDITRMKELELVVRIEEKMSSLGRVATGIAHELRNPLSAIKMYLPVLREASAAVPPGESDAALTLVHLTSKIGEATDRIEGIIKRVLDFAKPSIPKPGLLNLNRCIEKAIELSATTIRKAGIELKLILDANLPVCQVDPLLIENVLLNLIDNAVEALPQGHQPRIIAISSATHQDSMLIRVSDSGTGVPEEIREKIFDPFFTTKPDGEGIGLSMVHRIISDHGGTVEVTTSAWKGAEFVIRIPRNTADPKAPGDFKGR